MRKLNKDSLVALFMLMICGVFISALDDIERTNYGTVTSNVWPTIVLSALTLLCGIYFITSVRQSKVAGQNTDSEKLSLGSFFPKNVAVVFFLFGAFVLSLPYLGMLVSGIVFVFITLNALGERSRRHYALHLAVAIGSVVGMWAVFTYGLNVFLPEGELIYKLLY